MSTNKYDQQMLKLIKIVKYNEKIIEVDRYDQMVNNYSLPRKTYK